MRVFLSPNVSDSGYCLGMVRATHEVFKSLDTRSQVHLKATELVQSTPRFVASAPRCT
jgi:hypothetical protein